MKLNLYRISLFFVFLLLLSCSACFRRSKKRSGRSRQLVLEAVSQPQAGHLSFLENQLKELQSKNTTSRIRSNRSRKSTAGSSIGLVRSRRRQGLAAHVHTGLTLSKRGSIGAYEYAFFNSRADQGDAECRRQFFGIEWLELLRRDGRQQVCHHVRSTTPPPPLPPPLRAGDSLPPSSIECALTNFDDIPEAFCGATNLAIDLRRLDAWYQAGTPSHPRGDGGSSEDDDGGVSMGNATNTNSTMQLDPFIWVACAIDESLWKAEHFGKGGAGLLFTWTDVLLPALPPYTPGNKSSSSGGTPTATAQQQQQDQQQQGQQQQQQQSFRQQQPKEPSEQEQQQQQSEGLDPPPRPQQPHCIATVDHPVYLIGPTLYDQGNLFHTLESLLHAYEAYAAWGLASSDAQIVVAEDVGTLFAKDAGVRSDGGAEGSNTTATAPAEPAYFGRMEEVWTKAFSGKAPPTTLRAMAAHGIEQWKASQRKEGDGSGSGDNSSDNSSGSSSSSGSEWQKPPLSVENLPPGASLCFRRVLFDVHGGISALTRSIGKPTRCRGSAVINGLADLLVDALDIDKGSFLEQSHGRSSSQQQTQQQQHGSNTAVALLEALEAAGVVTGPERREAEARAADPRRVLPRPGAEGAPPTHARVGAGGDDATAPAVGAANATAMAAAGVTAEARSKSPRLLMLWASRSGYGRALPNEQEVLQGIHTQFGHAVDVREVHFERLPLRQQAALARMSDILAGPHGAALALTLFLKPGSVLLELEQVWRGEHYQNMAAWRDLYRIRYVHDDDSPKVSFLLHAVRLATRVAGVHMSHLSAGLPPVPGLGPGGYGCAAGFWEDDPAMVSVYSCEGQVLLSHPGPGMPPGLA